MSRQAVRIDSRRSFETKVDRSGRFCKSVPACGPVTVSSCPLRLAGNGTGYQVEKNNTTRHDLPQLVHFFHDSLAAPMPRDARFFEAGPPKNRHVEITGI